MNRDPFDEHDREPDDVRETDGVDDETARDDVSRKTAVPAGPDPDSAPAKSAARTGSRKWWLAAAALSLAVVIAALPTIVARTSLRDVILNRILDDPEMVLTSRSASFGWFSGVQVHGIEITAEEQPTQIDVVRLQLKKSWPEILITRPDLGEMEMEAPFLDLVVDDLKDRAPPRPRRPSTMQAVVRDAAIRVRLHRDSEPVIDLENLTLTLTIKQLQTVDGRVLMISPITIFDRLAVTPERFREGFQLVTPLLANDVRADGELSFRLEEFEVPLDVEDEQKRLELTRISGVVALHHVNAGLENPLLQRIVGLASDLLKLPDLRTIRVAQDAEVAFEVRDGRVFHEGMVFAFPELAPDLWFESSGSVGLDESLDLQVSGYFPVSLLASNELARELSQLPITLRIRGTLDEPDVKLPMNQDWVRTVGGKLLSGNLSDDGKRMADDIINLVDAVASQTETETDGSEPDGSDANPSLSKAIIDVILSGRKLAAERRAQREAEREQMQAERERQRAEKKQAREDRKRDRQSHSDP